MELILRMELISCGNGAIIIYDLTIYHLPFIFGIWMELKLQLELNFLQKMELYFLRKWELTSLLLVEKFL